MKEMTCNVDNEALFQKLKQKPLVAWPSVMLLVVCNVAIALSWYLCLSGKMPLWAGLILNSLAMYFLFSPIHDSQHRAVSRMDWVNQMVAFLGMMFIGPLSSARFLRMMHMQHHRWGNDPEKDPDHANAANGKHAFFHWFFWDFGYGSFYNKHKNSLPDADRKWYVWDIYAPWLIQLPMLLAFPLETLMLWFIPVRIMVWLVAAVFMYLPHLPHDVTHAENPYKATLMRTGWDWLLTPLLAYQNYHLVHHLYPTVPFYRYRKIWNARRRFHESHDPGYIGAFDLQPEYRKDRRPEG